MTDVLPSEPPTTPSPSALAGMPTVELAPGVLACDVGDEELPGIVQRFADRPDVRLADFFATTLSPGHVQLRLVYSLPREGCYLQVSSPVTAPAYQALSPLNVATFVEECEIYEQFGLHPRGVRLDRLAVPPHTTEFPRLGDPQIGATAVHAPHRVEGAAFEFPFGPVRETGVESLYFGLVTSGEELVDLYLFTWHKHRGVERRLAGLDPHRALFFVERVEGLSSVANALAFARAVEGALGIVLPPGTERTRAVALELERLYNHVAAIAALAQTTGLQVGQAQAEIALELCYRLNAAVFAHRYLFGVVGIGGALRAPDVAALRRLLPKAYDEFRTVADALSETNSFLDRLETTGVVTTAQASRLALVGPVARASGVDTDTRRDHPYPPYDRLPPAVAIRGAGDVLARMQVMVAETAESVRLVGELLQAGTTSGTAPGMTGKGAGLGWSESPRGESLAWVELDAQGRLARARIRPGSVRNWRGFHDAVRAQNVFTDVPIIQASFWLTVAGMAR